MQTYHSNQYIPFAIVPSALTQFQTLHAIAVSQQPNFDFWCRPPMCEGAAKGPAMMLYYTKDGVLHGDYVGVKKVIRAITA